MVYCSVYIPVGHGYLGLPAVKVSTDVDLIPTTVPPEHYWDGPMSCCWRERKGEGGMGEEGRKGRRREGGEREKSEKGKSEVGRERQKFGKRGCPTLGFYFTPVASKNLVLCRPPEGRPVC